MTVLKVILDPLLSEKRSGVSRYAEELTRALISMAPAGCFVEGVVAASPESEYDELMRRLPGLSGLYKSALARRELVASWQHGFVRLPGHGMVHATSPLAPLYRHDRVNNAAEQIAVTMHDALPWTHPDSFLPRELSWHKAMANRAQKYADAIVVPTHAVAEQLEENIGFGDRIRVISEAVSPQLTLPFDAESRARRLELPSRYLLTAGSLDPRKGITSLFRALARTSDLDLPLLIVGNPDWHGTSLESALSQTGLDASRVRSLGDLSDADLAVAHARATVFVYPSLAEGFGLPMLEAMSLGTPVVHSDDPALVEVAADAGYVVARDDLDAYPERLASAISTVLSDVAIADRMRVAGPDRAGLFRWSTSAEKVWQLHADL